MLKCIGIFTKGNVCSSLFVYWKSLSIKPKVQLSTDTKGAAVYWYPKSSGILIPKVQRYIDAKEQRYIDTHTGL